MPEFLTGFDLPWTFRGAAAWLFLIDLRSMFLGLTLQLFGKVMVPDTKKAKINIAVKCFCADDLSSGKFTIENSASNTGIQRPAVFCKMFQHILQKR